MITTQVHASCFPFLVKSANTNRLHSFQNLISIVTRCTTIKAKQAHKGQDRGVPLISGLDHDAVKFLFLVQLNWRDRQYSVFLDFFISDDFHHSESLAKLLIISLRNVFKFSPHNSFG